MLRGMILISRALAIVVLLLVAFGGAHAAQSKRFPVANAGALELQIPDGWLSEVQPAASNTPAGIRITAPGRDFVLLVTPAEIPVNARPLPPTRVRTAVERAAAEPEIAQRAEDPRIALQELRGPQASGYYFNVTDKTWTKAAAEDFHYMTQGSFVVGTLAVHFGYLSNTAPGGDLDAALDMLRSARHAP